MAQPFIPKQVTTYQAEHLAELQGDVSETVIEYFLTKVPTFQSGDVIHDNACGAGAVLETIMASNPPKDIHIDATDVNENFVQACSAKAKEKHWPVKTQVMPSQALTFPDNYFTHSFTNFAFHCLGDHEAAAHHVYRTLRSGGTAVATVWIDMPHVDAMHHAHYLTRGRSGPMPTLMPEENYKQSDLEASLVAGGFDKTNISFSEKNAYLKIPDLARWSQLGWSYLGYLPEGWSKADEDNWEKAVKDIEDQLKSGRGISKNEKGETVLKMVACVAVARKE
ncbi:MAG: hypothetical protein M1820_001107 [Bogoriella megaspora]|nr:MAG: hypothetical protein M1820_001107 [Bogoriella megaspora]